MPTAAAVCTIAQAVDSEHRASVPSGTHTLMLRIVDAPAANDTRAAVHDVPQRVRLFDRVRLFTSRLARFDLQLAPIGSSGVHVAG